MITTVVIRAECSNERISLQSILADGILPPGNPLGEFSRSFPDLNELAKHLGALPLENLQTFFLAEKNRSGDKIEFPGVKLPGESITKWGLLILLTLEIYFCIVFRDFCHRVTPINQAWEVPWIGISPDMFARIAFVVSILAVPITIGYLALRGIHGTSSFVLQSMYGLSVILSGFLAALIVFYWKTAIHVQSTSTTAPQTATLLDQEMT
jgi:hypothetical protein